MPVNISAVEPPPARKSGRKPRLTDEAVQDLANHIRSGQWASDHEVAPSKTAAYQRAQSAMDRLEQVHQITSVTSAILAVDENGGVLLPPIEDKTAISGWTWRVGPLKEGQTPRRRQTSKSKRRTAS